MSMNPAVLCDTLLLIDKVLLQQGSMTSMTSTIKAVDIIMLHILKKSKIKKRNRCYDRLGREKKSRGEKKAAEDP